MQEPHNIDDLLNAKLTPTPVEIVSKPVEPESKAEESESEAPKVEEKLNHLEQFKRDKEEILGKEESSAAEDTQSEPEKSEKEEVKEPSRQESGEQTDEYGNEMPKARTYTEDEVQRMIRDRLARGKQPDVMPPPTPDQVQEAQQEGFEVDPNSGEDWQDQLNKFIDKRLETKQKETAEKQWRSQQQKIQAQFEAKFTTDIQKYSDFYDVTADKPITNSMLMAARSMKEPAAFIYAACKQQPKELERIANIPDSYQQAAEMGRLEERMRKAKHVSQAPKPGTKTKGDSPSKVADERRTVDQLIQSDAKRKLLRR